MSDFLQFLKENNFIISEEIKTLFGIDTDLLKIYESCAEGQHEVLSASSLSLDQTLADKLEDALKDTQYDVTSQQLNHALDTGKTDIEPSSFTDIDTEHGFFETKIKQGNNTSDTIESRLQLSSTIDQFPPTSPPLVANLMTISDNRIETQRIEVLDKYQNQETESCDTTFGTTTTNETALFSDTISLFSSDSKETSDLYRPK
ncbi:unnamed protein product [[Candida] boidinii]|uniref:Unnamed protein product n=1 Tax=Candida boidinii TaxID=5477 RepID=A0A9W6T2H2_CANBO|nr:hypothetical protein B5S30_g2744 [[Candida] boidinii]GME69959.1 unnamed protein product [[Candida] boidinii]GMF99333.1 unnamed protein product [[Candida] boidinii]